MLYELGKALILPFYNCKKNIGNNLVEIVYTVCIYIIWIYVKYI